MCHALPRNPLSPSERILSGWVMLDAGHETEASAERPLDLEPNFSAALHFMARGQERRGALLRPPCLMALERCESGAGACDFKGADVAWNSRSRRTRGDSRSGGTQLGQAAHPEGRLGVLLTPIFGCVRRISAA